MKTKLWSRYFGIFFLLFNSVSPVLGITDEIISTSSKSQAELGSGYSTVQQRFKGKCITGAPVEAGINQANLDFSQSISSTKLRNELGFSAEGRASFGIVSTSAAAKFLSQSESDSYSITSVYSGDYQFKNIIISNPSLTQNGQNALKHNEFADACGDHYVQELVKGAKIYFLIRIEFASEVDKKMFESEFSISAGLWSAAGALKTANNRFSTRTKVKISAFQIGGKVEELSKVFGQNDGDPLKLIQCSTGKFEECTRVLESAIKYATFDLRQQFSQAGTLDERAATLLYLTRPNREAGVRGLVAPQVSSEISHARRMLDRYLNTYHSNFVKVDRYLSGASRRLSPRQLEALKLVSGKLDENWKRINEAFQQCWEEPSLRCIKIVEGLNEAKPDGLFRVSPELYGFPNESFAQYCDEGISPQASPDIRDTIERVITFAKTERSEFFPKDEDVDVCKTTENILSNMRNLDLSARKENQKRIKDFRPFLQFVQLEEINLAGNEVRNLSIFDSSPYERFPKLRKFNLSDNQISYVNGLQSLFALEHLDLKNNLIRNAEPLKGLTNLKRLDLRNNRPDLKNPISDRPGVCLISNFGKSGEFTRSKEFLDYTFLTPTVTALYQGQDVLVVGKKIMNYDKPAYDSRPEVFHLGSGRQEVLSEEIGERIGHTAVGLKDGETIVIFGGWANASPVIFKAPGHIVTNLEPGNWSNRFGHTATLLNDGRVLVAGGFEDHHFELEVFSSGFNRCKGLPGNVPSQSVFLIDFSSKSPQITELYSGLSVGRAHHTATLLKDGRVLFVGGFGIDHSIRSADIFDPINNQVQRLNYSELHTGRDNHQTTLLADGRVLITGGYNGIEGTALDSAEIFDPENGSFSEVKVPMEQKRALHQATLLSNGNVLITGGDSKLNRRQPFLGSGVFPSALKAAEIYVPNQGETGEFFSLNSEMKYKQVGHSAIQLRPGTVFIIGSKGSELYTYGN